MKTHKRIETALQSVLPVSVKIKSHPIDDTRVELDIAGQRIIAGWGGEGWLKQVRQELSRSEKTPDIIVVRKISPGTRHELEQRQIGWVDELGEASIAIGTIVVSKTGLVTKNIIKPPDWTPSVVAVAEAILCKGVATVSAIEKTTGLSRGSCTNALKALTNMGLLASRKQRGPDSARSITDYDKLLQDYVEAAIQLSPSDSIALGVSWNDPISGLLKIGQRWDQHGINWFATGAVASMVIAPYLTRISKAEIYVDADSIAQLQAIGSRANLDPIEGGRLIIKRIPTSSTSALASTYDGIKVAPWPRVYADLLHLGVRGEEAAEHLREVINERGTRAF